MGCYVESADDSSSHPGNAKEMLLSNFKDLWEWQDTGPSCKQLTWFFLVVFLYTLSSLLILCTLKKKRKKTKTNKSI